MLTASQSGNRCQGLYRGKVIKHLPHGRLKVYVYGVYPEEYINQPDFLPICEQITPLWGGSYNGNGSFSYPNIGSTVWVQFANEDANYPVVIGATLGGENSYNQYNNIKAQDEEVSKKHMFTTGMSHFQMHESGKISSYVQYPNDNEVSINFALGDVSCRIHNDIANKIKHNEITHSECYQTIDNNNNFGEIKNITHYYDPYEYESYKVLSTSNELLTLSSSKKTSFQNQKDINNIGETIENQISSIKSKGNYTYFNGEKNQIYVDVVKEKDKNKNTNILATDGSKKLLLNSNIDKYEFFTKVDGLNGLIEMYYNDCELDLNNKDEDIVNDKRNTILAKDLEELGFAFNLDCKKIILNAYLSDLNSDLNNDNIYCINNENSQLKFENDSDFFDVGLYANIPNSHIIISASNQLSDNNSFSKKYNNKNFIDKIDINEQKEEAYLEIQSGVTLLSTIVNTVNHENVFEQNNENTNESISKKSYLLSTYTLNSYFESYYENIDSESKIYHDIDNNIKLIGTNQKNIITIKGNNTETLNTINKNEILASNENISFQNYYSYNKITMSQVENLTSDTNFKLCQNDCLTQTNCNYNKILTNYNGTEIITKDFEIIGDALNDNAGIHLKNKHQKNTNVDIDKNTSIVLNSADDNSGIELTNSDNVNDITCYTKMSTTDKLIETKIVNDANMQIYETSINADEGIISLTINDYDENVVKLELTQEGILNIESIKEVKIKTNTINAKSDNALINATNLEMNSTNAVINGSNMKLNGDYIEFTGSNTIFSTSVKFNRTVNANTIKVNTLHTSDIYTNSITSGSELVIEEDESEEDESEE